ncbi:hypothetical protein FRC01_006835, partial [Tulasnella sp. 417]
MKTKSQTKKQIAEENERLKRQIAQLQAQGPSQDPESDENRDPWAAPPTSAKQPMGTPAGQTTAQVLKDITSAGQSQARQLRQRTACPPDIRSANNPQQTTPQQPSPREPDKGSNHDNGSEEEEQISDRRSSRRTAPQPDDDYDAGSNGNHDSSNDDRDAQHHGAHDQPGGSTYNDDFGFPADDEDEEMLLPTRSNKKLKRDFPDIDLDLDNAQNPHICFNVDGLIARPRGEPGRVSTAKKQGFCLRRAMGYPPELPDGHPSRKNTRWDKKNKAYNFLHEYGRQVIDKWLEPGVPYFKQDASRRVKAEKAWLAQFPRFPSIYEKNWPMDAIFSTIMQNNKKRLKSRKPKNSSEADGEHDDDDDDPFGISLPDGRILRNTINDTDNDDNDESETPLHTNDKSSRSQLASSSRTAVQGSGKSSSRKGASLPTTDRPSSSTREGNPSSSGSSPLASRSRSRVSTQPQLPFTLVRDPAPKQKASASTAKKAPKPAPSRKGKEVARDDQMDVDDEDPEDDDVSLHRQVPDSILETDRFSACHLRPNLQIDLVQDPDQGQGVERQTSRFQQPESALELCIVARTKL